MAAPDGTAVAPVVETPQAPAPTPSTLETLEERVDNELNANTGASATPVDGSQAPVDPNAAPDPQAEETPPAEADGKNERVLQENAAMKLAFQYLGLNADSPVIDQINSGLLTREQILGTPAVPQAPVVPPAPTITTEQKLANLDKVIPQEGDVSADDFRAVIGQIKEVVSDVVRENQTLKQARDQDNRETLSERTASAATAVFESEVAADLPADVKAIAQELFLGAVDNKVYELAADPQVGQQRALSVEGYTFAAKQLAPKFDALIAAIKGTPAPVPLAPAGTPAAATPVRPLAPGGGAPSPAPPAEKGTFAIENLETNVDNYMASQTLRVGA